LWLQSIDVKAGDWIDTDQTVAQVDTDKATIDVRTPVSGNVEEILMRAGDAVVGEDRLIIVKGDTVSSPRVKFKNHP